ncbi:cytochrome P450, partial [Streptomyces seoulensis]
TTIPRGAELALLFGSANHDETVFDTPTTLDLTRKDNPHISFSAGTHYCIGAALARLELGASMRSLLTLAPTLTLASDPARKPGFVMRGLEELKVTVGGDGVRGC